MNILFLLDQTVSLYKIETPTQTKEHIMMQFKTSGAYQVATNSIKHVAINRSPTGWWLNLPEGDLYTDKKQMFCFNTFNEAKRHAEANVGMKMNWEDF